MTVEYACVFGISSPIPGLLTGEHVNSYSNGLCVITFHGKDGRVFWFIIKKLPHKFLYPNTPRYSASDAADFCDRLSSTRVWKDIRVADLWKNKICASMTALEEGILETWSFDRIVLFGDSIHKVCCSLVYCVLRMTNLTFPLTHLDDSQYRPRRKHCNRRRCYPCLAVESDVEFRL